MRSGITRLPMLALVSFSALGCAGPFARDAHAETPAAYSSMNQLEKDYRQATALLYAQTEDGSLRMLCTATAFERTGKVYHFVTAAHCVAEDDTTHDRVEVAPTNWFITFDEPDNKSFVSAKVLRAGYQHRGDDFAVLEVNLEKDVPIMPLAANDPSLGENVCNFASPMGLGKQLFRGHVSMEKLDRPLIEGDINWKGATLLQMSSGPGSSGSAIVSTNQKGVIAFLVGVIGGRGSPNIVSIPVSKFKKFNKDVADGKYKWYKPEGAEASKDGASSSKKGKVQKIWERIHKTGIVYQMPDESPAVEPSDK